ncbi:MAG: NAD-dependent epimerase/dehydratase family protein [Myxococcota bacterium]
MGESNDIQRVLVTGAAGGVGRHVVRALLDAGYDVRAADRVSADEVELYGLFDPHEDVDWRGVELLAADLVDVLDGCDAVIHTAARVSLSETYQELAGVNVDLVEKLYDAASRVETRHFIHFSCGTFYQGGRGLRVEHDITEPTNAFEQTKLDSEQALHGADSDGAAWTILRPSLVYGPHCQNMGSGMITLPPLLQGFMPYLPGLTGGPRTNWCHVEDAASAAVTVLGNEDAFGQTYNVADDTPLGFGEVITSITEAYELEVGALVPFPNTRLWSLLSPLVDRDWVFGAVRQLLRGLWRRLQDKHGLDSPLRPRLDRNALFYVENDSILGADALKGLGWRPSYPDFRKGIVGTVRWYQLRGWAPRFDAGAKVRRMDDRENVGFGFHERLGGRWRRDESQPWRDARLELDVRFANVERWAFELEGHVDGTITLEGFVDEAPTRGTFNIQLLGGRCVGYEMGMEDSEGRPHRLSALRKLRALDPLGSLTTIAGRIIGPKGQHVGDIELQFDLGGELAPTLMSLHLVGRDTPALSPASR